MKKSFVKYLILFILALYPCVLIFGACKDKDGTESSIYSLSMSETETSSLDEEKDGGSYAWDESSEESSSEEASSASLEDEDDGESASVEEDNGFHDDFEEGAVMGNP